LLLCLEFGNNILIFAVLERWLLQLRETDSSFGFIILYNELAAFSPYSTWPCDRDLDIDPFAHLYTTLDNVTKFRRNWVCISGTKP